MKEFSFFVIVIMLFTGCSSRISSIGGNYNSLFVEFDSKTNETYLLISDSSYILDKSKAYNGKVEFILPKFYGSNFLSVTNDDKDEIKLKGEGKSYFSNTIWSNYNESIDYLEKLENRLEKKQEELNIAKNNLSNAKNWLNTNRLVYKNGNCVKPNLGEKPNTACSPSEKSEKAIAICAMGAGGCDVASDIIGRQLNSSMANYLSSQACSAYVAHLKDEYYQVEDMLGTFAVDFIDNVSNAWMESDSLLVKILGYATKVGIISKKVEEFYNCVDYASLKCSKVYDEWDKKPTLLLNKCNDNLNKVSTSSTDKHLLERDIEELNVKIQKEKQVLNDLKYKAVEQIFYYQE